MKQMRRAMPTLCLVTLSVAASGCGFVLTHGPPPGHQQLTHFSCTEGNAGPILDVVWGALNLVGSIALATDQSYTQEEANQIVASGVVWAGLFGTSAGFGFSKTKKCRAAMAALAERQRLAPAGPAPGPPAGMVVTAVVVTPGADTLLIGERRQLTATAHTSGGVAIPGKTFTWRSSNDAIASVSNAGLVTAHAAGSVAISANTENVVGIARIEVVTPPQ